MEKSFQLEKSEQEKINYTKCIYVLFIYMCLPLRTPAKSHTAAESCIYVPIRITHPFSASGSHVFVPRSRVAVAIQALPPCDAVSVLCIAAFFKL